LNDIKGIDLLVLLQAFAYTDELVIFCNRIEELIKAKAKAGNKYLI
jgi:hypothetical protein